MVIGIGDGFTCLSSDLPSILPLTRDVIRPQDGEIVTLWTDRVEVRSVKDGKIIQRMPGTVTESMDEVQKGGYPNFMLKEIHEQAQVARELIHLLDGSPLAKLAPLPAGAQFINVIESVFSGMAKAIIHNSDYASVKECRRAINKYFSDRNRKFKKNPKRAGNKIWGKELVKPQFNESNNCKDPNYQR